MASEVGADGTVAAVLNWEAAVFGRSGGRQVLVLELPTSTSSAYGTRPVTATSLDELADRIGFTRISGSGRVSAASTWQVSLSKGGVHVRDGASSLLSLPLSAVETGRVALISGDVDIVVTTRSPRHSRSLGAFLREEGRAAVGGCGVLSVSPALDRGDAESCRYSFVSSSATSALLPPPGTSVLIDQSILVDAEKALAERPPPGLDIELLRDRLAWMRGLDCIPGFGIDECARGKNGLDGGLRLSAAWEAWTACDPLTAPLEDMRVAYRDRLDELRRNPPPELLAQLGDGPGPTDLNYLALLESVRLWAPLRTSPFVAARRIEAYESWIAALNRPGTGIPGHMGIAVRHLLLGRGRTSEDAAALLKLTKERPRRSQLIGAAWDLLYVTLGDMVTGRVLDLKAEGQIWVATADRLLAQTRTLTALAGVSQGDHHEIGMLRSSSLYLLEYSPRQRRRIEESEHAVRLGAVERAERDVDRGAVRERAVELEARLIHEGLVVDDRPGC